MDSALDKITRNIIDAESLYVNRPVDKDRYLCRGCEIPVTPASYEPHNQVRAYFTANKQAHRPGCDVDGEMKLLTRARKERVTSPITGFPASYPSELVLLDTREQVENGDLPLSKAGSRSGTPVASVGQDNAPRHRKSWTARTIRPLARTFVKFPFDRDLALKVPGIDGGKYYQVFRRVKSDEIVPYMKRQIFYAPISWSKPLETETALEIALGAGEWEGKKLVRPYRLQVQWRDWSSFCKSAVTREIEIARLEAIEAGKANRNVKGWIFFLGHQSADDLTQFFVEQYELICCLAAEMIYPPRIAATPQPSKTSISQRNEGTPDQ
jgi:hypothetical protein